MDDLEDMLYPMRVDVDDPTWLPDEAGFSLRSMVSTATEPLRVVANTAHRAAMAPLYGLQRAVNAVTPGPPGGGGRSPGASPGAGPSPDQPQDPGDGGEGADMSGHHTGWKHFHPGNVGFRGGHVGFAPMDFLRHHSPFGHPAGKLLVSAVPGGVAATQAHSIASKALADGTLKPAHLKKAGILARFARGGHRGSIKKIAGIKAAAGRGDPHAEVALDRLRLADSIQRGGFVPQRTTHLAHLRQIGLSTLKHG